MVIFRSRGPQDVRQAFLREFEVDLPAHERSEGEEPHERAFEDTDVGGDAVREELEHARRDLQVAELGRIVLGLLLEDAEPQLVVGRMKVDDKARLHPARDAVLDAGNLGRRAVGRNDDLLVLIDERVERVEELLLRRVLPGDELHVIDHQHVDRPEQLLERHHVLVAQRLHEAVHELFGRQVDHAKFRTGASADARRWRASGASCRDRRHRKGTAD